MKKRILILILHFYPGYRIGGPQRTIENVIDCYGDKADFYVYTLNHDMNDNLAYDLETGKWLEYKNAKVCYMTDEEYFGARFEGIYDEFDSIYSCSLFAQNSIRLLQLHHKKKCIDKNIYIAPMGVLEQGAYSSKAFKKKTFVYFFKKMGYFKDIIWSFTSEAEKNNAISILGAKYVSDYIIAEDLPRKVDFDYYKEKVIEKEGTRETLKVCFISRICSQKNLNYALEILNTKFPKKILFDIYGVIEDEEYWEKCQALISELPEGVTVNYKGAVSPEEVVDVFSDYDVFLFPTKGENFGHVIYESLAAGCIPVISDRTPWEDFDARSCGYVNAINEKKQFIEDIFSLAGYRPEELRQKKLNAISYAEERLMNSIESSGYKSVL